MKLNQIIAVANGVKSRAQGTITAIYQKLQKSALLEGISRTYRSKSDEGDQLPTETKLVQLRVPKSLNAVKTALVEMFDIVATQDLANCNARSDVVLDDGFIVLEKVPVTHLLFLEKQLVDLHTLISKLPVLDPAEAWNWSPEFECYATDPEERARTKRVPKYTVTVQATDKHPAQVVRDEEEIVEGYWKTVKFSGAISQSDQSKMITKICKLQDAVKKAREKGNSIEIEKMSVGKAIFDYLFGD